MVKDAIAARGRRLCSLNRTPLLNLGVLGRFAGIATTVSIPSTKGGYTLFGAGAARTGINGLFAQCVVNLKDSIGGLYDRHEPERRCGSSLAE